MGGVMDPITIMSILVLAGFIGAGADLATGGLVRAELGGGSRGAGSYIRTAGSRRVREARAAARRERMKTPMGRAVQFVLDEVGALGRGLVRGWRSGRQSARTAWRERLGGEPLPAVRVCTWATDSARTWLDRHTDRGLPNGLQCSWTTSPNWLALIDYQKSCGQPATVGPLCAKHAEEAKTTPCIECGDLMGSGSDCSECQDFRTVMAGPYGPLPNDPNGAGQDPIETRTDTPNGEPERAPNDPNEDPKEAAVPNERPPGLRGQQCPNDNDHPGHVWNSHLVDPGGEPVWCQGISGSFDRPDWPNSTTHPATQPTRTEGTTVADINSAPAAIALFEAFRGRFEEPESLLTALRDEIAAAADSMGDFAIGGEGDLSGAPQAALDALVQAREAVDAYLSALHLEYDASIEAADAKRATAHRPMQEV